jgi:dipeptidyl aminopeptidase/acylaminoacyl peptidase
MKASIVAAATLWLLAAGGARAVDIEAFARNDNFETIKISPTGEYFAATVPFDDRTALVIMSRADKKLRGTFQLGRNTAIADFDWVNPKRVLISVAEKLGNLAEPEATGELYAMDADGGNAEMLVGQRMEDVSLGTHLQTKKAEKVAAFLVDDLPADDKYVLIEVMPLGSDPYSRLERMDVTTGKRNLVVRAPERNADFYTDNQGVARFVEGHDVSDNSSKLYYRADDRSDWKLVNDEAATGRVERPIGFSADNGIAYLQAEQQQGPDAIVAYDVASGKRTEVLRDKEMDPRVLFKPGTRIPVGAAYEDGKPRLAFFDEASPEARLYRSLQAAFGDNTADITSSTSDGRLNLVVAWSDRNPGDFYLFDSTTKKAEYVVSAAEWFDPAKMAVRRPVSLAARDGLVLKGYLTVPNGMSGSGMPLVVMPHGGPFQTSDEWGFDPQAQMLASAGYAVLQVNFRGSNNRGRQFEQAGARQWGLAMQDDLTDATKWAVQQGIAAPNRICIYGASYGGYAALMGVAKEPGLYKCAAGYVGVYDLPQMHDEDSRRYGSARTYANQWVGEDMAVLAANSPTQHASSIKVPVFMAAGREDETAPIQHTERMERALKAAGAQVETAYYDAEGHGFYKPENRKDFYTRLLAFLARSLGGGVASAPASASASAAGN